MAPNKRSVVGKKFRSTKAPGGGGGGQQAYKKNQKKSGDLFFFFFGGAPFEFSGRPKKRPLLTAIILTSKVIKKIGEKILICLP